MKRARPRRTRRRKARRILPRAFYERDVVEVARDLLGKRLVSEDAAGRTAGRIIETEAYLASRDPASHSHRGQNRKNATMFGPAGHAYVYVIHARHCVNVVTQGAGTASAVLIRAVEPVDGVELMLQRRTTADRRLVTRGPARLCEAMSIDRSHDGCDLTRGAGLWIEIDDDAPTEPLRIVRTPRVGVTAAKRRLLRFCVGGHPLLSRPA